jgi:hypothetical protein
MQQRRVGQHPGQPRGQRVQPQLDPACLGQHGQLQHDLARSMGQIHRCARRSIGLRISTAQGAFNAAGVFGAMIVPVVVALLAEYAISLLEQRLLKWRPASFS